MVTTNDEALAKKIRMLREYGWQHRYISDITGRNSRLDELQAAILRVKLQHLDADNGKRRAIAEQYSRGLDKSTLRLPKAREDSEAVYHLYVIQSASRELLVRHLGGRGVQTGIHYPMPIHLQPAYKGRLRTAQDMSVTERLAEQVLSLPMYPELLADEIAQVIEAANSYQSVSTG